MLPSTVERVPLNTAEEINEQIRRDSDERIACCAESGREAMERRLAELDQEWDIERALEANAATASLVGVGLAAALGRRWLALPAMVGGFLLQHALQGWCPPLPLLRRLRFRTATEIEYERDMLRVLLAGMDDADMPEDNGPPLAEAGQSQTAAAGQAGATDQPREAATPQAEAAPSQGAELLPLDDARTQTGPNLTPMSMQTSGEGSPPHDPLGQSPVGDASSADLPPAHLFHGHGQEPFGAPQRQH